MLKSEDFHFLRVIKYGKTEINRIVYLVQHKGTKEYFALKKFLKPTPNESREKKEILFYVNNEIDINLLLYASDLSIPKLHGYWSTKEAYFLLYDFIEGMNLRDFLIEQKKNHHFLYTPNWICSNNVWLFVKSSTKYKFFMQI